MTTWIEFTQKHQDGEPTTQKIQVDGMSEDIVFTTNGYAEVTDSVADLLASAIDVITKLTSAPTSPGTYYDSPSSSITINLPDGSFADLTAGSGDIDVLNTDQQSIAPLKVGVVGDSHWASTSNSTGNRFSSQSDLKSRLDTLIDDYNNWGADLVIHIGDFVDGTNGPGDQKTVSEIVTNVTDATDYLENTGGSSGNGLNAQVEYVMGNHEEIFPRGSPEQQQIYDAFGFADEAATYRVVTKRGINFALLNTAITETNYNNGAGDHKIPTEELNWARSNVQPLDSGTFSFIHVPVSFDTDSNYQSAVNQNVLAKILADTPSHTAGWFGHVHNTDHWKTIKEDYDNFGNKWLHTGFVYDLQNDTSYTPYGKLTIHPWNGMWKFNTSYSIEDTGLKSSWEGNIGEQREQTPARNQFESSWFNESRTGRMVFPRDRDQMDTSGTGTWAHQTGNGRSLVQTGSTSGDTMTVTYKSGLGLWQRSWYGTRAFRVGFEVSSTSSQTAYVVNGSPSGRHFGIYVDNGTVYGTVHDGSVENNVQLGSTAGTVFAGAACIPGERAEFWMDPEAYASTTSNVPPADRSGANANKLLNLQTTTNEAANNQLFISEAEWFIDRERSRLDMPR